MSSALRVLFSDITFLRHPEITMSSMTSCATFWQNVQSRQPQRELFPLPSIRLEAEKRDGKYSLEPVIPEDNHTY
jgi:hypothetical protein